MRRLAIVLSLASVSVALVHCVGDEPAAGTGSNQDGGEGSDGSSADGASDGATVKDSGGVLPNDAGPGEDLCIGHSDCPSDVEVGDLQLWLRGNIGSACVTGRLSSWNDQSGKGHDAHPGTFVGGGSGLAPQCGTSHIDSHAVVSFSAPAEPDGGDGGEYTQYVDETLDLDMQFVVDSDYTIFVVHRRAIDAEFGLIGQDRTTNPNLSLGCLSFMGSVSPQNALYFGYNPLPSTGEALEFANGCYSAQAPSDTYVTGHSDVVESVFSSAVGHALYSNGALLLSSTTGNDKVAVQDAGRIGVIGRGFNRYSLDSRYRGDIAEIIAYSRALTDPERLQIEGYLKRQWGLTF